MVKKRDFLFIVGSIFGTVGILHLLRAVKSWDLLIENFSLPIWVSYLAGILLLFLSYYSFRLSKK